MTKKNPYKCSKMSKVIEVNKAKKERNRTRIQVQ
jgi:hypothetical protein